ncbi:MAG: class I SAM-dependent methyltransferase [Ancalomicrobiaceae bacterium]|nr:class I SAM-dependent methyltransferase [Ancalomicrobiaceae bacterium]
MHLDVVDLRNFYGEPLGQIVRLILRRRIRQMWPRIVGDRLLGMGYATPFMRPFLREAERTIGFMPARQGVVNWPSEGPSATALVDETDLPLPNASIDRVLAVHLLELVDDPAETLREIWRVMAPGGRLIAVVPSRRSVWARVESTPFGVGRPFSRHQLDALLKETLFSPIDWQGALFTAPISRRFLMRSAPALERIGAILWPALSGVIIVEATKQIYQGLPARIRSRHAPAFRPLLIPGA